MGFVEMTKDKLQVLSQYRLDNCADDDDKFWCYVRFTSAIAHRAPFPFLVDKHSWVPCRHAWEKICKMFGANIAMTLHGMTEAEVEATYQTTIAANANTIKEVTISTCMCRRAF